MDLLTERQSLIDSLNCLQQNMTEMERQFAEMQVQKERIIGAIMLIDKWLETEKSPQEIEQSPV